MRIFDIDAHIQEPTNWLEHQNPKLAAELPPARPILDTMRDFQIARAAAMPEDERPEDPLDLMPSALLGHMRTCDAIQPDRYDVASNDPFYLMDARIAQNDADGIDVQWLNPSLLAFATIRAMMSGKKELVPQIKASWNAFAAERVAAYKDRLQPTTQINVEDLDWSLKEMARMREAGSRAFVIEQHPTKSLTHPDFERMWSAAEDLGMAAYIHVQFGQPALHPSWNDSGRRKDKARQAYIDRLGPPAAPSDRHVETRTLLNLLVLHGVFEDHPKLRLVLGECGFSWLVPYMNEINAKASKVGLDGKPTDSGYRLPLLPSEYLQRHVRVCPTIGMITAGTDALPLAKAIEALPEDMIVFSTDYPHPEGRACSEAVKHFDETLPNDAKLRERFYSGSMEDFLAGLQ